MTINLNISFIDGRAVEGLNSKLDQLLKGNASLMSNITDFAAAEQVTLDAIGAKLTNIQTGVSNLDTLITTLQGTITGLTPEEQAALDAVTSASAALLAQATAIDTTAPVAG